MTDFEISLNKVISNYPAFVKEAIVSDSRDETGSKCASISKNRFCWLISKTTLYVWRLPDHDGKKHAPCTYQLPLAQSGLPYTADTILVFDRGDALPGVLAVSGEGNIRYWPVIGDHHTDTVVDLQSEVALSIQMIYYSPESSLLLLTTTTGTFYRIETTSSDLRYARIGSAEQRTVSRRLSTMIFGSQTVTKRYIRSIFLNEEFDEDDEDEEVVQIICALSTTGITLFDLRDRRAHWSIDTSKELSHLVGQKLRALRQSALPSPRILILDGASYRKGALILISAIVEDARELLLLVYYDRMESNGPRDPTAIYFLNSPLCEVRRMRGEESSFLFGIHLSIPDSVNFSSPLQCDGISIIHPNLIQVVRIPDDPRNDLAFNKHFVLPNNDVLVGHASDDRYSYLIRVKNGISSIRILPQGFEESEVIESVVEHLKDGMESGDSSDTSLLKRALLHFISKNLHDASRTINRLLDDEDVDLAQTVHEFLSVLLDSSCSPDNMEQDVKNKRHIYRSLILFLKSTYTFDSACAGLVQTSNGIVSSSSYLAESGERIEVALALLSCMPTALENRLITIASRNECSTDHGLFARLSSIHSVFSSVVSLVLNELRGAVDGDRTDLLGAGARILLVASTAIEKLRASASSVELPPDVSHWTYGKISKAYGALAMTLMSELDVSSSSMSDLTKEKLVEQVTRLIMFSLTESRERCEGNELLMKLYNLGYEKRALELAERFKDFNLLVKITLTFNDDDRRRHVELYKRRFAEDNFELYLCEYYLQHKHTQKLLEQRGGRVDEYVASHEGVRWRRELQNEEYEKAAHSLTTLAEREEESVRRQKALYSLAYLSACCQPSSSMDEMKERVRTPLMLIQHRENIPEELIKQAYPACPEVPLNGFQLIDLNMTNPDDTSSLMRALSVIVTLLERSPVSKRAEVREKLKDLWKDTLPDKIRSIRSDSDLQNTNFGRLLNALIESDLSAPMKESLMPLASDLVSDERVRKVLSGVIDHARILVASH